MFSNKGKQPGSVSYSLKNDEMREFTIESVDLFGRLFER